MKLVAFLRAVNVGGRVVRMEDLRRVFAATGQSNVETFIASGNVIFDSKSRSIPSLTRILESALEQALKYPVTTFIRTMSDVARIAAYRPFGDAEGTLYVGFLSGAPKAENLKRLATPIDRFHLDRQEVYWHRSSPDSEITGAAIEKALGVRVTLRNINTVQRIAAKYQKT